MITTTVKEAKREPKRKYPYIGELTGTYVLFTEPQEGVVIVQEDKRCSFIIGHYSEAWPEKEYEVFEGEIILKNS